MSWRRIGTGVLVFLVVAAVRPAAAQTPTPTQQAQTQRDPEEGFGIGGKFGPLFASLDQTGATITTNNGFIGGLLFGGNRPGLIGVMAEVLYAKKGGTATNGVATDLYFIEVPVLLRVNVGAKNINKFSTYGIVGPAFDILLKGQQGNLDVKSNYEDLNLSIVGGGGVEFLRFLVEARGMWGVRNINKGNLANTQEIRDRSFALMFGVRFN